MAFFIAKLMRNLWLLSPENLLKNLSNIYDSFYICNVLIIKKSNLNTLIWRWEIEIFNLYFIANIWYPGSRFARFFMSCNKTFWFCTNRGYFKSHFFNEFSLNTGSRILTMIKSSSRYIPYIIWFFAKQNLSFFIIYKSFSTNSVPGVIYINHIRLLKLYWFHTSV